MLRLELSSSDNLDYLPNLGLCCPMSHLSCEVWSQRILKRCQTRRNSDHNVSVVHEVRKITASGQFQQTPAWTVHSFILEPPPSYHSQADDSVDTVSLRVNHVTHGMSESQKGKGYTLVWPPLMIRLQPSATGHNPRHDQTNVHIVVQHWTHFRLGPMATQCSRSGFLFVRHLPYTILRTGLQRRITKSPSPTPITDRRTTSQTSPLRIPRPFRNPITRRSSVLLWRATRVTAENNAPSFRTFDETT
jgi:hypothetical protein